MAQFAHLAREPFLFDKRTCLLCPNTVPVCEPCPTGFVCQGVVRTCDACQSTTCAPVATPTATPSPSSSGPNVGAIAGGVVGGIFIIALLTYLVWRTRIKTKRREYAKAWPEFREDVTPTEKDFSAQRDVRGSTHTMHSIASTVLTRASNIIQIAYIPGVTNRSAPSTPGLLVPPMPAIPIALASPTSSQGYEDQHFFMPGDLRDSTYSGMTDRTSYARTDRTSYARNSVATRASMLTRNSVTSTIYGKNAVVSPVPTQTIIRARPAVVSVKSSAANSPGEATPPVPSVDWDKYNPVKPDPTGPPSPPFSIGETFLNNATAATQVRPSARQQVVRIASSATASTAISTKSKLSQVSNDTDSRRTLIGRDSLASPTGGRDSAAVTLFEETPLMEQGPFVDPPARIADHARDGSLSAVIEEATLKAQSDVRGGLGFKRDGSPFGDENATGQ